MTQDLALQLQLHPQPDPATLAQALAAAVADDLRAALAERGQATLALSGGNTPKAFMQALSHQDLDWSRVQVTLVDERWVPESNERSNARLLREHLLQGRAARARFLPLYRPVADPEQALQTLAADLAALGPRLDVAVLGMGADGHTASFFPGGDHLAQALDPAGAATVLPMRAPGAGEPRITLSLAALLAARRLYLHVEGQAKREVLQSALDGTGPGAQYPIRTVLQHAPAPVLGYWCA